MRTLAMFLTALVSLPAVAKSNLEAVQLDLVPLNHSVPCNRTFFRSSSHFNGTVFYTPRVVSSGGPDGEVKNSYAIFPIKKTKAGEEYRLDVYLFFPRSDEQLRPNGASSQRRDTDGCNIDAAVSAINKNRAFGEDPVKVAARIPLTSIDVSILGIKNLGRVGRLAGKDDSVDFLTYNNRVLAASILITKEEKAYFLKRVRQPGGLPAQVTLRLQGRQRDGSVHVEIDAGVLQSDFKLAVKAKPNKMVRAEVKTALHAAMSSRSIRITSEAGSTDAPAKATEQIMEKVFKEISLEIDKLPDVETGKAKGDADLISIEAVLGLIATSDKREIKTDFVSVQVEATHQDEVRIKATDARDSNVLDIEVKADYIERSSGVILEKGQTMAITVGGWREDSITYDDVSTDYLSASQVGELELHELFPHILDPGFNVENDESKDVPIAFAKSYYGCGEYRWKRTQYFPRRQVVFSRSQYPAGLAPLAAMPVGLSFSAIGGAYVAKLSDLMQVKDWWDARYDEKMGQILITAKHDLGLVQFKELMDDDVTEANGAKQVVYADKPQIEDEVTEEFHGSWCARSSKKKKTLYSDSKPMIRQRVYTFSVIAPDADAVQDVVDAAPPSDIVTNVRP